MARSRERLALRGREPAAKIAALIDPSEELASYRVRDVLAPSGAGHQRGLFTKFGPHKMRRTLASLQSAGHYWATPDKRLRELTRRQRQLLAAAVILYLPQRERRGLNDTERRAAA